MLQLFNSIILIIRYLGFVLFYALFFCFKATRPLIYQLHVVSYCLAKKVDPAGNHILSLSDLFSAILILFPQKHKLHPITLTSTDAAAAQEDRRECCSELSSALGLCLTHLSHGRTGGRQPSPAPSPSLFWFPSCCPCRTAQTSLQKVHLFSCKSRPLPSLLPGWHPKPQWGWAVYCRYQDCVVMLYGTKSSLSRAVLRATYAGYL